ncbi:hypothetical protein PHMEG_00026695, partial [Phytophthora megakarya]
MSLFARSPVALQVDLEELRFSSGARDFTSVITTLQTMLHDAGYAFLNLVPTWGCTLSPELLAARDGQFMSDASFLWGLLTVEQVAWNEIARGRHYSVRRDDAPFQTLGLEVTSAFPVEEDGDTLMLTPEEQELLGVAMLTRLRLANVRPRDWSDSNTSRPERKRRRGSTDAPLSVPSWPGSDEATRSRFGRRADAAPDENMSSAGGGSQGSPGLETSAAMVGVYMATTGTGTGQPYTAEQPTLYVPVAEYPPGQDARPPPLALPCTAPPVRNDGLGGSEEETKSDVPMTTRGPHLPENSRDWGRRGPPQQPPVSGSWGAHSSGAQTSSQAYRGAGREPQAYSQGAVSGRFPALPWSAPGDTPGAPSMDRSGVSSTAPTWNSSFESADVSAARPGDSQSWGSGGPGAFGFPTARGYAPGYGVSFRPFIAYDAVE